MPLSQRSMFHDTNIFLFTLFRVAPFKSVAYLGVANIA